MKRPLIWVAALVLFAAQHAFAAVKINEIYFSPEDPKDDRQFFELISDVGVESLDNLWFLEIEGDLPIGVSDNPGQVLNAFDLTGLSTGTNGLFLWRSTATVLDNSPAPGIQGPGASGLKTQAFNQIFGYEGPTEDEYQNNVHTFLLVENFTGSVPTDPQEGVSIGDDLDTDDDGTLDSTPWTSVLDGISAAETGDAGYQYAGQFGGLDFSGFFGPDVFHRLIAPGPHGAWAFFDSSSGDGEPAGFQGPFFANDGAGPGDSDAGFEDGTEIAVFSTSQFLYATPGAENLTGVPEPSSAVLAACAAALFGMGLRRCKG